MFPLRRGAVVDGGHVGDPFAGRDVTGAAGVSRGRPRARAVALVLLLVPATASPARASAARPAPAADLAPAPAEFVALERCGSHDPGGVALLHPPQLHRRARRRLPPAAVPRGPAGCRGAASRPAPTAAAGAHLEGVRLLPAAAGGGRPFRGVGEGSRRPDDETGVLPRCRQVEALPARLHRRTVRAPPRQHHRPDDRAATRPARTALPARRAAGAVPRPAGGAVSGQLGGHGHRHRVRPHRPPVVHTGSADPGRTGGRPAAAAGHPGGGRFRQLAEGWWHYS